MLQATVTSIIMVVFFNLLPINTQIISMCDTLKNIEGDENNLLLKSRQIRALCDVIQSSRGILDKEDSDLIPDFDLAQINTENDANQILKRFRRGRSSSSSGGRSSSSSGSRSSSSSSSGSRFFGGSRSSSSSSSGGSSRIFSRSSSSSSSSSGSGTRIFSRSRTSSGGTSSGGTSSGSSHRVREGIRSIIRKPTSSGSGVSSRSSGLPGTSGSKPGFSDKIRKLTHSSGGGGSGFGMGGSGGSGGNVWARAGKKFLPYAVRYGKRYYQRRKYNKGMYAGMGAGAGYYGASRMNHQGHYYPDENYGYPPTADNPPDEIDGKTPTVFYCIQEDLNTTLVNKTLNDEGFGVCNISGKLVSCPIEIECKTSEADNCCEDEQGAPSCCGGPIPEEYVSIYGGHDDDWNDGTESLNKMLNIVTVIWIMMSTICYTIWQQRE